MGELPNCKLGRKICEKNSIWKRLCIAIQIRFISFHFIYTTTHLNWLLSARINHWTTWTVRIKFNQFLGLFAWSYLWQKYTCVMCIKWAKISYTRKKSKKRTKKKPLATEIDRFEKWNNIKRLNLLYFILFYFIIYNCVVCTICVWVCTHALIISKVNA